ncbi:hypothetical protein [Fictibacillus halophilus]|uniref:hypothetical protein n=1 Tax=Fictibacillus halophilus TaxID=1610490 RepID=UPI001CFA1952|nr:hypothetical protein [Fictibacillus halophilus]
MKKRDVLCLICNVKLHPTDWLILKKLNKLPICDICDENGEKIIIDKMLVKKIAKRKFDSKYFCTNCSDVCLEIEDVLIQTQKGIAVLNCPLCCKNKKELIVYDANYIG